MSYDGFETHRVRPKETCLWGPCPVVMVGQQTYCDDDHRARYWAERAVAAEAELERLEHLEHLERLRTVDKSEAS